MSCDSVTVRVSSLSAFTLRRSFDWPEDPGSLVVEFAWVDIGADPGPGAWESGSWVTSGSATLQAAGDDGLFGWVAETPVVGPLPVGTYGLWTRITDGSEIPVVRRDVLESYGSSTSGSASSGPSGSVAAGNMWVADGTGWTVFPVGTDGQVLYADSSEPSGVVWDDPPSGGGGGGALSVPEGTIVGRLVGSAQVEAITLADLKTALDALP